MIRELPPPEAGVRALPLRDRAPGLKTRLARDRIIQLLMRRYVNRRTSSSSFADLYRGSNT